MNTKSTRKKTWLLSGLLAAGITGYIPVIYNSPDNSAYAQARRDTDGDGEWVKYESLPRNVKRALDRERGNHEVKKIVHVDKENREYWRAIIDNKGDDEVVVINKDGEVLRRGKVDDVNVRDDRNGVRRDTADRSSDRDRGYDGRGTWVKFNQTPRPVQEALDRERGNAEVKQIIRVSNGDETYYRATINDRKGDRLVVLNSKGRLLDERETGEIRLARGRYDADNDDTRARVRRDYYNEGERVDFDRLPGEVKSAIGREAGSDRVREVTAYSGRGGSTIYRAEVSNGDNRRIIRVDERGRVFPEREANTGARGDRMRFNELPGEVKTAVGHHTTPDKIESIIRETRNGRTQYVVESDEGPTIHTMTFNENGRMVDEEERRDRN